MTKRKDILKEISLPVKFNPGTQKYEPELPARKSKEKIKVRIKFKDVLMGIFLLIAFGFFIYWLSKKLPI